MNIETPEMASTQLQLTAGVMRYRPRRQHDGVILRGRRGRCFRRIRLI